jgi:intracellular multiplication protein IcmE
MANGNQSYGVGGSSGRFRTFTIFLVGMVFVIGTMGYLYYARHKTGGIESKAVLTKPPSIGSVPGEATTPEYARTVEQENIRQAQEAAKSGGSSVATIVRPSFVGAGAFESSEPAQPGCSFEELKRARDAGVAASELKCRGCSAKQLRAAGYTAGELVNAGYGAAELKAAGFTAAELRAAGLTAAELRKAGFSQYELAQAGYTVCDLIRAGAKPQDLQAAGFKDTQLAAAGVGISFKRDIPKNCEVAGLTAAKTAGITPAELRILNCGAAALRAAGYSAKELRDACYTIAELKAAGFTAAELKAAGFTAAELKAAGFSAKDLKDAGFSAAELHAAGFNATELKAAGFSADDLSKAGYTAGDLRRAGFEVSAAAGAPALSQADAEALRVAKAALENPCSELSLKDAKAKGKTYADLKDFRCTEAQLQVAGIDVPKEVGKIGAREAIERGLTPDQRREMVSSAVQTMDTMTTNMFGTWAPPDKQVYVAAVEPKVLRGARGERDEKGRETADEGAGGEVDSDGKPVRKAPGHIIKAGTVFCGTIDTSINSDEKSPVLATIVTGELKGSRLVGEFTVENEVVVVKFNKISVPSVPNSLPLEAYAIDPDTARTALAHEVDNHYLLRYGSLFASSFLSGLGSAISSSGSQTSSGAGGILTTHDPLNTSQQIFVALGNVGTQFAAQMGSVFTRPPTVTVESGAGIGILFTSDLSLPAPTTTLGQL